MKDVRPTSSRVLLALFSILGGLEGVSFLDLFAGTGHVGIEALKRGASPVVFVEVLKDRARGIERAIPDKEAKGTVVLALELRRATEWLSKHGYVFDVIFADPPYHQGWGNTLLNKKNKKNEKDEKDEKNEKNARALTKILKQEGVLVVEHASREPLHIVSPWAVTDVRSYGETTLTFLRHKEPENEGPHGEHGEPSADGRQGTSHVASPKEALS